MKRQTSWLQELWTMQRLIWIETPDLRTRVAAAIEYSQLSRLQRRVFLRGGLFAALTRAYRRIQTTPQRRATTDELNDCLRATRIAEYVHPSAACVATSVRLLERLAARGLAAGGVACKIGVLHSFEGLRGHAWLERDGLDLLTGVVPPSHAFERVWTADELLEMACAASANRGRYRLKSGVLCEPISDENTVLLDLDTGEFYGLDRVGHRALEELVQHGTIDRCVRDTATETGVAAEVVRADLEELCQSLMQSGLLLAVEFP